MQTLVTVKDSLTLKNGLRAMTLVFFPISGATRKLLLYQSTKLVRRGTNGRGSTKLYTELWPIHSAKYQHVTNSGVCGAGDGIQGGVKLYFLYDRGDPERTLCGPAALGVSSSLSLLAVGTGFEAGGLRKHPVDSA